MGVFSGEKLKAAPLRPIFPRRDLEDARTGWKSSMQGPERRVRKGWEAKGVRPP